MRLFAVALGFCALLAQGPARADAPSDPLSWLGRIASAGQRLNYVVRSSINPADRSRPPVSSIAWKVGSNMNASKCSMAVRAR